MLRSILAFGVLCAYPAAGHTLPEWPEGLAHVLSAPDSSELTNRNLAAALAPYIVMTKAGCTTADMPADTSQVPISTAIIAYGDENACNRATPLALLELYIEAKHTDQITRLYAALANDFHKPCFVGVLPSDARRHAPARHQVAWHVGGRVISVVAEDGNPQSVALSAVALDLQEGPGVSATYQQLRHDYLSKLPANCR